MSALSVLKKYRSEAEDDLSQSAMFVWRAPTESVEVMLFHYVFLGGHHCL